MLAKPESVLVRILESTLSSSMSFAEVGTKGRGMARLPVSMTLLVNCLSLLASSCCLSPLPAISGAASSSAPCKLPSAHSAGSVCPSASREGLDAMVKPFCMEKKKYEEI
jgi:hypothetical protein